MLFIVALPQNHIFDYISLVSVLATSSTPFPYYSNFFECRPVFIDCLHSVITRYPSDVFLNPLCFCKQESSLKSWLDRLKAFGENTLTCWFVPMLVRPSLIPRANGASLISPL